MYIKTIVIDGFKSYAQRTEVTGFDPQFNAITGLNGSGKSNILDSICFLLGISSLSQVRASSLQELVYKSGQAGITRATVSITFDNNDKKNSPVGYENLNELTITRQVVIGGRNKYLINGCNASCQRIQDLFGSVQLNINNPHFLIMQGRITKVLNMKPPEILSMIEEAAGTRMYEEKKQSVQRTIEKKDSKLREIETVLSEEITPTLDKLREERSSYLEYQKVIRELEHLTRLYIAYQFITAEETNSRSAKELEEMNQSMQKLKDSLTENDKKIKEISAVINELEKKKSEESGSILKQLEKKVDELSKVDVKAHSDLKHMKEQIQAEKKKSKELSKSHTEDQAQITKKEKELVKFGDLLAKLEEQSGADSEAVKTAQEHYHAVSAGLSSNDDGEDKTLADQIMTCKNEISSSETQAKQAQMKLKHSQTELSKKQKQLKSTEQGYKKDKDAFDALQKQKAKIESEMEKVGYVEGTEEQLTAARRGLENEVSGLRLEVDNLEAKYPVLNLEFQDPEPGFDRRKVKGAVAQLVKVKDPKMALALEACAGGKLQHMVVDNEITSKKLVEKGRLKKRTTIIPLNKIRASTIAQAKVKKAEELVGKNNVFTALSLLECDKEVEVAIQYAFGGTFVCTNMDIAKKVAFHPNINTRTVTMDGEIFDPSGTLSGGARERSGLLLIKAQAHVEATKKLSLKKQELSKVLKDLDSCKKQADKHKTLKNQLELKTCEVELCEARLKQSTHHQQLEEINALQKDIEEQGETINKSKETITKNEARCKEIENKMKEAKSNREKELKSAEEGLAKAKKKAVESSKLTKTKQQEVKGLNLEIEELKQELENTQKQIESVESTLEKMHEQLEQIAENAKETKKACDDAEEELKKLRDELKSYEEEAKERLKERKRIEQDVSKIQLEVKELEHTISKHEKDSREAANKVEAMLAKYDWIESERHFFGQANTAYDFAANDMKEVSRRLHKLEGTKAKLANNVNMRAMNMLDKAEEKYNDLMRKKEIVENDRAKIEAVIRELDEKKKQAVEKAWEQVNKDFGSIFSTLLPGTIAKLSPPEGGNFLDGLEVKVGFGTVWKESLGELSGGQRSLVALSLILSLLLFKPAPLYILDEIDAALDLSHTQNIGLMLRTHFRHSQFIVVSLKDGMFTNANVLFKTKFVDGTSTVTRHVQRPGKKD